MFLILRGQSPPKIEQQNEREMRMMRKIEKEKDTDREREKRHRVVEIERRELWTYI